MKPLYDNPSRSGLPCTDATCALRHKICFAKLPRGLLLDLCAEIQEWDHLASVHPRQHTVPLFNRAELDQFGALLQGVGFPTNRVRPGFRLHFGRVRLSVRR